MIKKEKIAVVSGCYDPLTPNDLNFLKACKCKSDWLIVGYILIMLFSTKLEH